MIMTLSDAAAAVLNAADPAKKIRLTYRYAAAWRDGAIAEHGATLPPDRPARPEKPEVLWPRDMPKRRRGGSEANRVALLHALAHIELNAIDLAWDAVARFGAAMPKGFSDDWVQVADDEARHFEMLEARMAVYGKEYGDLPAHDGLWQAALETRHDVAARLAVVPMVLEARGLDVTPAMWESLRKVGDPESAAAIEVIHAEEITHVAAGHRWFAHACRERGQDPVVTWQALVRRHFKGQLKRPFNAVSRGKAGLTPDFYEPLADER
ncbi:MAG TPA: ferritin-like domain-containing protein [Azospirillaceae bacterium]|nr:ferritin-like domain-containing protein [Azospirillaceae bacterium]